MDRIISLPQHDAGFSVSKVKGQAPQIRTGEDWLYAAVILDAFNREVITWAVANHETPRKAIRALTDAIKIRRPVPTDVSDLKVRCAVAVGGIWEV